MCIEFYMKSMIVSFPARPPCVDTSRDVPCQRHPDLLVPHLPDNRHRLGVWRTKVKVLKKKLILVIRLWRSMREMTGVDNLRYFWLSSWMILAPLTIMVIQCPMFIQFIQCSMFIQFIQCSMFIQFIQCSMFIQLSNVECSSSVQC